jgi:hypothetical protein
MLEYLPGPGAGPGWTTTTGQEGGGPGGYPCGPCRTRVCHPLAGKRQMRSGTPNDEVWAGPDAPYALQCLPGPRCSSGWVNVWGAGPAGRLTNVLTDSDDGLREGEGEVRAAAAHVTHRRGNDGDAAAEEGGGGGWLVGSLGLRVVSGALGLHFVKSTLVLSFCPLLLSACSLLVGALRVLGERRT